MYATVNEQDQTALRLERLRALECDHARCALLLEEEPGNEKIKEELADFKRRIRIHQQRLENSMKVEPEGGGSSAD